MNPETYAIIYIFVIHNFLFKKIQWYGWQLVWAALLIIMNVMSLSTKIVYLVLQFVCKFRSEVRFQPLYGAPGDENVNCVAQETKRS